MRCSLGGGTVETTAQSSDGGFVERVIGLAGQEGGEGCGEHSLGAG